MNKLRDYRRGAAQALLALVMLAGAATLLSACNTAAGFGEDMRAAGQAITGSADRVKNSQ